MRKWIWIGLGCVGLALAAEGRPMAQVEKVSRVGLTPPLSEMATSSGRRAVQMEGKEIREVPRGDRPTQRAARSLARGVDGALQTNAPTGLMSAPLLTFEGPDNIDGVDPPDTCGDVGPNHYVAMVNMHFCIYDKETGEALIEPMLMSQLYAAAGFPPPTSTTDDGDPIVLYDPLANRWLISQFIVSVNPCHEVIAISQTEDPTGEWFLYDFVMPNDKMNDYPKFGVWPDGYYMSDNQFNMDNSYGGAGVFVFEREKMLVGDTNATYQYFDLAEVNENYFGLLPADLDGPPPPAGSPNLFAMVDDEVLSPVDALYLWEFRVDWEQPEHSTFGNDGNPNHTNEVASFDSVFPLDRNTVPQPGVAQRLDPLGDRLMHRLQYRNFGEHESLVVCHTVNVGNSQAGTRYYELRRPLQGGDFVVQEQATFAPDAACRWMGSAAMDSHGNLAVGYSVSSTNLFPSIRYAGRLASDPSNGLWLGEATLFEGAASQTGGNRWGDYTTMSVDPQDESLFWFIGQYSTGGWNWRTRIGCFRIGDPQVGTVEGEVHHAMTGDGVPGATLRFSSGVIRQADDQGQFSQPVSTGEYTMVVSAPRYYAATSTPFEVNLDATTRVDVVLHPVPLHVAPDDAFVASGMAGGPFTPATKTYVLSNACGDEVTWAVSHSSNWLTVSATAGTLDPGEATNVVCRVNASAEYLDAGQEEDEMVVAWSSPDDQGVENRVCRLTITPWIPPVVAQWDFSEGLPDGGSVVGDGWRFDDPGARGNLTGGEGGFAIADSDFDGDVPMDTELRMPAVAMDSNLMVSLSFRTDYRSYSGNEGVTVDWSAHGEDGPWETLWQAGDSVRGPTNIYQTLPSMNTDQVRIRFHYVANYDYWWQVDDIVLYGYRSDDGVLRTVPQAGVDMTAYAGDPMVQARTYLLTHSGEDVVAWTARCDAAWFEVVPSSGTILAGETALATVQATAEAQSLGIGTREGMVEFRNSVDEGMAGRLVKSTVLEPLTLTSASNWVARGLEGGPFTPASATYTLHNLSAHSVSWSAGETAPWLDLFPRGGTLAAGGEQPITMTLVTNELTAPGVVVDALVVSNHLTGTVLTRAVTVTVAEVTGRIGASDSIAPTNDHHMPFGVVSRSAPRIETITVRNTGENERNLTVSEILLGYYQSTFEEGADGWNAMPADAWAVTNGAYVASGSNGWMTSSYVPHSWGDATVEVLQRRSGATNASQGVALRTTDDFEVGSAGSGYLFVLSGAHSYSVFRQVDGASTALQGWTYSPAIQASTNLLSATASGDQLRLAVNGTLLWEGKDSQLTGGHVALGGYATSGSPVLYAFDDVRVMRPQPRPIGVGRKQLYFNGLAQPSSRPTGPDEGRPVPTEPAWPEELDSVPNRLSMHFFTLTNLPTLPAVLAPDEELQFNVVYEPETVVSNADNVLIRNNDNFTPEMEILLDARAASARLTGSVLDAYTSLPLTGAQVEARKGEWVWSAGVGASESYSLVLPAGEGSFQVTASHSNYISQATEISLLADGLVATQSFELSGSRLVYRPASLEQVVGPGGRVTNTVVLSNSGPLTVTGTLMATSTLPASTSWCEVLPSSFSIASGAVQSVAVVFDASGISSVPPAVCSAELALSGSFVNPLPPMAMTLRISGESVGVLPAEAQAVYGCVGGPFSPTSVVYTVRNLSTGTVHWEATTEAEWIGLSATNGTLATGAAQDIVASVKTNLPAMEVGRQEGRIRFFNRAAAEEISRTFERVALPARSTFAAFDMDTDPGWSAQGAWEYGQPLGGGSHNQDPLAGSSGVHVYGYNLSGDYSNQLPRRALTTLPIDVSNGFHLELEFQRWLGIEASAYDHASVEGSSDGQNWVELWAHQGKAIADAEWVRVTLPIPDSLATNSTLRLRWVMGATDDTETYPGWNIDDVIVRGNRLQLLTVQSPTDQSTPGTGIHWIPEGVPTTCLITQTVADVVRTQFVYVGWAGSGDVPESGTATNVSFTPTQPSVLTWLWSTNVLLSHSVQGGGAIHGSPTGWVALGSSVLLSGEADSYYHFAQWAGEVESTTNPLSLDMFRPWDVIAVFDENQTSNTHTPEWWLARYGWTNEFEAAALLDDDRDGVPASDEYVADTDPTDPESVLRMNGIVDGHVEWRGGTGVVQYLEWSRDVLGTWSEWATHMPPMEITHSVPLPDGEEPGYFRIRTVR